MSLFKLTQCFFPSSVRYRFLGRASETQMESYHATFNKLFHFNHRNQSSNTAERLRCSLSYTTVRAVHSMALAESANPVSIAQQPYLFSLHSFSISLTRSVACDAFPFSFLFLTRTALRCVAALPCAPLVRSRSRLCALHEAAFTPRSLPLSSVVVRSRAPPGSLTQNAETQRSGRTNLFRPQRVQPSTVSHIEPFVGGHPAGCRQSCSLTCSSRTLHEQTAITACIESLSFVDISNMRRRAASILLEAEESDKDGGFWAENQFFRFAVLVRDETSRLGLAVCCDG